jgi:hypothetical protein
VAASAQRYAGWSGIAFVVLFGVGNAIWALDMPEAGAPAAELVDFYRDTSSRIIVGASLSMLAVAAFVLFSAALRRVLVEAVGDDLLATTAFGGALLGAAAGLGAETINMTGALRAEDDRLNEDLAQLLFEVPQVLGSITAGVGIGIFALATATLALRNDVVLSRWLAFAVAAVGIVLLTPLSRVNIVTGAAMLLIVAAISVSLLRRAPARH